MPRYVVERTFSHGLVIPEAAEGARVIATLAEANAKSSVTWILSYVSDDRRKTFCVYDAPCADAIRDAAHRSNLPIDNITAVDVLDPYSYRQ